MMLVPFEANYRLFWSIVSTGKKKEKKFYFLSFVRKTMYLKKTNCFSVILGHIK